MIVAELREMQDYLARAQQRIEALINVAIAERGAIQPDRWTSDELHVGAGDKVADLSEAVEAAEYLDPVEVVGLAEVRRCWVVRVPIGDSEGFVEGTEIETFATKAEADAYVARFEAENTAGTPATETPT